MNISDIEDAFLFGKAMFLRWQVEFDARFNAPHIETLTAMTANKLSKLPQDVQNISRQQNPDEWNEVDNYLGEVGKNAKKLGQR